MNDQSQVQSHRLYSSVQIQQPSANEQPQQSSPPSKKKGNFSQKRTWVFIFALVVAIGIITNVAKGESTSSLSNNSVGDTSVQVSPVQVSGSIAVSHVICTLVYAKHLVADNYIKPKPENQFIVVHVKLVNKGTNKTSYNQFDFHVKSGSGNITDMEYPPTTYTANNQLSNGQLAANSTVEGDIIFEVHVGDHKAQLMWQPSIIGNSTDYAWNLGL